MLKLFLAAGGLGIVAFYVWFVTPADHHGFDSTRIVESSGVPGGRYRAIALNDG